MSFDWHGYIAVAEALKADADAESTDVRLAESCWRASISRAYYAAYNLSVARYEDYWKSPVLRYPNKGVHASLIHSLQQREPGIADATVKRSVARVAKDLARLVDMRVKADYENELLDAQGKAAAALRLTRRITVELGNIRSP